MRACSQVSERDLLVPPGAQRRLASLLGARALTLSGGHMGLCAASAGRFRDTLLETVLVGEVMARAGGRHGGGAGGPVKDGLRRSPAAPVAAAEQARGKEVGSHGARSDGTGSSSEMVVMKAAAVAAAAADVAVSKAAARAEGIGAVAVAGAPAGEVGW
jgi:hypothetical protein